MADTFYRTRYIIDVLHDRPIPSEMELVDVIREGDEGDFVLSVVSQETYPTTDGPTIAALLRKVGSEPGFFGLDDDGKPVDE